MEDGQSAEKPPVVCNCTEKCEAGAVNTKCEVCSTDMTGCTGKEAEPETPAEPAEPEKKRIRRTKPGCPAAGAGCDGRRCLYLFQIH